MTKVDKDTGKSQMQVQFEIKELTGITTSVMKGAPDYPLQVRYLWNWFVELSKGRSAGPMAANAINWSDMSAYFSLIGVRPMRWELNALRALDDAYLESRSREEVVLTSAKGLPQMKEFKVNG